MGDSTIAALRIVWQSVWMGIEFHGNRKHMLFMCSSFAVCAIGKTYKQAGGMDYTILFVFNDNDRLLNDVNVRGITVFHCNYYSWYIIVVRTGNEEWFENEAENTCLGGGIAFLIYAIQVYLIFALAVPVFVILLMRKRPIVLKGVCATVFTVVIAGISYKMVSVVSAPYTSSTIGNILTIISENGIYAGCCYMLDNFFVNLDTVRVGKLMEIANDTGGILLSYFACFIVLLFALGYLVLARKFHEVDIKIGLALYFLLGFLVGYCFLYTGSSWTLCRGTNTGLLMALIFIACSDEKDAMMCKNIALLFSIFSIGSSWWYLDAIVNERSSSFSSAERIVEEKQILADVFDLAEGETGWNNTIAHYGTVNNTYLALPTGFGYNYMLNEDTDIEARYAIVTNNNDEFVKCMIDSLNNSNYTMIHNDEFFVVFEKTGLQN